MEREISEIDGQPYGQTCTQCQNRLACTVRNGIMIRENTQGYDTLEGANSFHYGWEIGEQEQKMSYSRGHIPMFVTIRS